uniref:Uncharacterized protein n=1 Tax=Caenorhabditis japonica TaxID=281687 RepID=A0A8R1EAG0_CAEJA
MDPIHVPSVSDPFWHYLPPPVTDTQRSSVTNTVYIRSCFFVNFSIVNVAFSDFPTLLPKKRPAVAKEKDQGRSTMKCE